MCVILKVLNIYEFNYSGFYAHNYIRPLCPDLFEIKDSFLPVSSSEKKPQKTKHDKVHTFISCTFVMHICKGYKGECSVSKYKVLN